MRSVQKKPTPGMRMLCATNRSNSFRSILLSASYCAFLLLPEQLTIDSQLRPCIPALPESTKLIVAIRFVVNIQNHVRMLRSGGAGFWATRSVGEILVCMKIVYYPFFSISVSLCGVYFRCICQSYFGLFENGLFANCKYLNVTFLQNNRCCLNYHDDSDQHKKGVKHMTGRLRLQLKIFQNEIT